MRRLAASTVLLVFLLPLTLVYLPGFFTASATALPPCCRRGGKHHCGASADAQSSTPNTTIRSSNSDCPFRGGSFVAGPRLTFSAALSPLAIGLHQVQNAANITLACAPSVHPAKTNYKRGPPDSFSC